MPDEVLNHLPQQWVGLAAVVMFGLYVLAQIVEKYPTFAKFFPGGVWWHERQLRKAKTNPTDVTVLERQVAGIARTTSEQATAIAELQTQVSAFTAWSVYDARWHHRAEVQNAQTEACTLSRHYDFFAFERIWRTDPLSAARLSDAA